jgi:hypothetical protein
MAHNDLRSAVAACLACADACEQAAAECLQEPVVKQMIRRVELGDPLAWSREVRRVAGVANDCAQLCRLTAALIGRDSEMSRRVAALCAALAERCAAECGRHGGGHFARCAAACRTCADACATIARPAAMPERDREAVLA